MREILIRGKRIGNSEWVYGYYVPVCFGRFPCKPAIVPESDGTWEPIEVKKETVGQYTGLTDKNGRKIFEGDICRMKADRLKGYGAIIFMGSAFVLCDKTHKKTRYYPLYPDGQFTVVGNIHDNPELLEVEK